MRERDDATARSGLLPAGEGVCGDVGCPRCRADQKHADAHGHDVAGKDGHKDARYREGCEEQTGDPGSESIDGSPREQHRRQSPEAYAEQSAAELSVGHPRRLSQRGQSRAPHTPENAETGEGDERKR